MCALFCLILEIMQIKPYFLKNKNNNTAFQLEVTSIPHVLTHVLFDSVGLILEQIQYTQDCAVNFEHLITHHLTILFICHI